MDGVEKKEKVEKAVTSKGARRGRLQAQDLEAKTRRTWQDCSGISVMMRSKNNSRVAIVEAEKKREKPEPTEEKKESAERRYRHPQTSIYLSLQVKKSGTSTSGPISTSGVGVRCA